MPGLLLDTLRGENTGQRPIWLMRQAGRYLPEYRTLRAEKGGFLALVYDEAAAAEITLQPIRRFGFDGAILFSDILIVPYAMGQDLRFLAGEGPQLSPRLVDAALDGLQAVPERLAPIYATVSRVRAELDPQRTLLGFAGSPWTVATYMVAGEGSRDQHEARAMAYRDPPAFQAIIDAIVELTIGYLAGPDFRRSRGGAIVRQLGRDLGAGGIRALGDRPQRRHRRRAQGPIPARPGDRFSQRRGRKTAGLCARNRRRCHRAG